MDEKGSVDPLNKKNVPLNNSFETTFLTSRQVGLQQLKWLFPGCTKVMTPHLAFSESYVEVFNHFCLAFFHAPGPRERVASHSMA